MPATNGKFGVGQLMLIDAHLVFLSSRYHHITLLLHELRWPEGRWEVWLQACSPCLQVSARSSTVISYSRA